MTTCCVVCRADHPLAALVEVPWRCLRDVPMIAGSPGYGVRRMTDAAAAQAGVTLKIVNQVSDLSSALWMVASGLGVAIFPSALVTLANDGLTVVRPLAEPRVMRSISQVTRQCRSLSPACECFVRVLMQELRRRDVAGLRLDSPWLV